MTKNRHMVEPDKASARTYIYIYKGVHSTGYRQKLGARWAESERADDRRREVREAQELRQAHINLRAQDCMHRTRLTVTPEKNSGKQMS
jgi:hypothetical protein